MTWQSLIKRALRLSGAIYPGQAYSAELNDLAFEAGSMLLSAWSRDRILPPALTQLDLVLSSGKYEYTAGPGGDFPARPLEIDSAIIWGASLGDVRNNLRIETWTNWRKVALPDRDAVPTMITMNPHFPLATIIVYPSPSQTYTVSIAGKFAWEDIMTRRTDEAVLPPGYADAFCDCLADKIADELQNLDPVKKGLLSGRASNSYKNMILSMPYWDGVQSNPRVGAMSDRRAGDPWARFVAGMP